MDLTCTGARMGQALVKTEALQGLAGARALGAFGVVVTAQSLRAHSPTWVLSQAGPVQPSLAPVTVAHGAHEGDHHCPARSPRCPSMWLCRLSVRLDRRRARRRATTTHTRALALIHVDEPLHGELP